jgi:hypothetical protein
MGIRATRIGYDRKPLYFRPHMDDAAIGKIQ